MTSNDEALTVNTLTLILDKHFAQTDKQLALMREDNAKFREQIRQDFDTFKKEVREDLSRLDMKLDKVYGEVIVLQRDVEGLKHDVAGLYHWDYWLLSIILIVFVMPQFIVGIQSFFKAITEGIRGIRSAFKGKN